MLKHIIFDFDGTIVQSRMLAVQLFNQLSEKYKYSKIDEKEIEQLSNLSIKDRIKLLNLPVYKLPQVVYEMKKNYKREIITLEIVDGIREVLYELKAKGLDLGIISSNTPDNIELYLKRTNIDVFSHIYCASNVFGKQRVISEYMKKYKLLRNEVVYIGDELRDVISCKKAGIPMAAVAWGYDSIHLMEQAKPEFTLHSPGELLTILNN